MEWYEYHPIINRSGHQKTNPVDEKDPDGLTALHYACRFNRFRILQYLLTEKPGMCGVCGVHIYGCGLCVCMCVNVCVCTLCMRLCIMEYI